MGTDFTSVIGRVSLSHFKIGGADSPVLLDIGRKHHDSFFSHLMLGLLQSSFAVWGGDNCDIIQSTTQRCDFSP